MGAIPIKVATLNFSGLNSSPFEFFSDDPVETKQLLQLGQIFHQLIKMEFKLAEDYNLKNQFDWGIGDIDKVFQRQRYSPIYQQKVGLAETNIMSRKEFQQRWQSKFQKHGRQAFHKKNKLYPSKLEIQRCKTLDYLLFKTFVQYIYSQELRQEFTLTLEDRKDIRGINQRYEQFMSSFFKKEYLQDKSKVLEVIEVLKANDIFFFQDLSPQAYKELKQKLSNTLNIKWNQNSRCAIAIWKKYFQEILTYEEGVMKYELKNEQELNNERFRYYYDQPSLVIFAEKQGYIFMFISLHLTSGQRKEDQIKDFMCHMVSLRNVFKKHKRQLNIIVGGDFNDFIGNLAPQVAGFSVEFRFTPGKEDMPTTIKKRTALHAQMTKSNQQDRKCRDFIVTHLQITKEGIITSRGKNSETVRLLPSNENPFDHYIVQAVIKFGGWF